MKNRFKQTAILVIMLAVVFCLSAQAAKDERIMRVGLFYGSQALPTANLENNTGSGYRFGYYDGSDRFVSLGDTGETQISMLKTQNIYLKSGAYYDSNPGGTNEVIGSYHIQLSGAQKSFDAAQDAAGQYQDAFPAWSSGTYYVRVGAFESREAAEAARSSLGLSGTIVGTSPSGISVTKTKTTEILFQFDSTGDELFAISPGQHGGDAITWFKGFKYYGTFRYERIDGGNLTVVNYVGMDDYAKGILPYEMSASWPEEALKAQAVASKSYALTATGNRHTSNRFEVCNTTCCQVYQGTNKATNASDAAVDAVSGVYAWHNGALAQTFYYSCNGGASEDSQNVWSSSLPYLAGVEDPYESTVQSSISGYRWQVTYTGPELASRLQQRGYSCGSSIEAFRIKQLTKMGNVHAIELIDNNGKSFQFAKENVRTVLGLKSIRFQLDGSGGADSFYVDEGGKTLPALDGLWAIGDNGTKSQLSGSPHAITSTGTEKLTLGGGGSNSGTFVLTGTGNGHSVGMSQWGAYAMAKAGHSYEEILSFYFTGIDLH